MKYIQLVKIINTVFNRRQIYFIVQTCGFQVFDISNLLSTARTQSPLDFWKGRLQNTALQIWIS